MSIEDSNDGISFFICLFSDISHETQFKMSMKRKRNINLTMYAQDMLIEKKDLEFHISLYYRPVKEDLITHCLSRHMRMFYPSTCTLSRT
jgi:hypothetical protein